MAEWECIGWFQIRQTFRFWPKSRLLIGREPEILRYDWSRGRSENFQRGYPYGSEPLPILCQLDQSSANQEDGSSRDPVSIVQDSSQGRLIGRFPLLKGNGRLGDPEMKYFNGKHSQITVIVPLDRQLTNPMPID